MKPLLSCLTLLLALPTTQALEDSTASCTNTSIYGPVVWQDSQDSCCFTKIIEPKCSETAEPVSFQFPPEPQEICKMLKYRNCTEWECPQSVTIPEHRTDTYTPWGCTDTWVNVTQRKRRVIPHNTVTEVCDELWVVNEDGEMVSGGRENCRDVTWHGQKFEFYDKVVQKKASNCTEQPEIEYNTCRNTTEVSQQYCTKCVDSYLPKCSTKHWDITVPTVRRSATAITKVCQPQTETVCNWNWKVPTQKFTERHRCPAKKT